jgi:hypothetical protein
LFSSLAALKKESKEKNRTGWVDIQQVRKYTSDIGETSCRMIKDS